MDGRKVERTGSRMILATECKEISKKANAQKIEAERAKIESIIKRECEDGRDFCCIEGAFSKEVINILRTSGFEVIPRSFKNECSLLIRWDGAE